MPIRVKYTNFKPTDTGKALRLLDEIRRDASWGTVPQALTAVERSLKANTKTQWDRLCPVLEYDHTSTPEEFNLIYADEQFDLESEGVDHFVSTIAGNILNHADLNDPNGIRVDDIEFVDSDLFAHFPGPALGIDGVYSSIVGKTLDPTKRPLVAFTVKPRCGLSVEEYKGIFESASSAGIDIIEDDQRLLDPTYCRFEDRVRVIGALQKEMDRSRYSVNVTGPSSDAIDRVIKAHECGIRIVKFDVLVGGFESLRQVRKYIGDKLGGSVAITVFPDATKVYRNLSVRAVLKLARLCGGDIIYGASPKWSRFEGNQAADIHGEIRRVRLVQSALHDQSGVFAKVKKSLPTLTNDQHPIRAELITALFRKFLNSSGQPCDWAFFVGGGISGFPGTIEEAVEWWLGALENAYTSDLNNYVDYSQKRGKVWAERYYSEFTDPARQWTAHNVKAFLK